MHLIIVLVIHVLYPLFLWPLMQLGHLSRDFLRGLGKDDWYVTQGTVDTVRAKQKGYLWRVRLYYSYSAESDYHSGVLLRKFVFEADVDRFMREHPANSAIKVRYRPARVTWTVILDRDQRSTPCRQAISKTSGAGTA
jgi:hypothetical protein